MWPAEHVIWEISRFPKMEHTKSLTASDTFRQFSTLIRILCKVEPGLQKLPGVGKFFKACWPYPPLPPQIRYVLAQKGNFPWREISENIFPCFRRLLMSSWHWKMYKIYLLLPKPGQNSLRMLLNTLLSSEKAELWCRKPHICGFRKKFKPFIEVRAWPPLPRVTEQRSGSPLILCSNYIWMCFILTTRWDLNRLTKVPINCGKWNSQTSKINDISIKTRVFVLPHSWLSQFLQLVPGSVVDLYKSHPVVNLKHIQLHFKHNTQVKVQN